MTIRTSAEHASSHPPAIHGTLSRSNPRRRRIASLCFGALASVGVVLPLFEALTPALLYPSLFALLGAVAAFTSADRDPGPSQGVEGALRIGPDGVVAEGDDRDFALSLARDDIADGFVEPHPSEHTLVLCANNGTQLRLSHRDVASLEAALGQLGLDERAVRMPLVADPRMVRGCMGVFMGVLLVSAALTLLYLLISLFSGAPASLALLAMVALFLAPVIGMPHFLIANRVLIGRDGVLVQRLFRPTRFFSYERLRGVSADLASLQLVTHDGAWLSVRASGGASTTAARIIDQRLGSFRSGDRERTVAALERGNQPLDAWRATLQGLLDPARATFRRAVIRAEDLLAVAADPSATPTQRVSAAFALASQADAQPRLRIIAEGCAHPKLRIALESASAGALDEAALAEAERDAASR